MRMLTRYAGLVEAGERGRWVGLILFAVLVSGVEALAALAVYFIVTSLTNGGDSLVVPVLGDLHERYPDVSDGRLFAYIACGLGLFFVLRGLLNVTNSYLQHRTVQRAGVALSDRLLRGYLRRPYPWHLRHNSAELIRTAHDSVEQVVANVFVPAVGLGSEALVVVAISVVLLVKAPVVTVGAGVVLAGLMFVLLRVLQPRMVAQGHAYEETRHDSLSILQQSLAGIRDIKVLGRRGYFARRFNDARARQGHALAVRATLIDVPRAVVETFVVVILLGFVTFSRAASESTSETIAVLSLFAYAVLRVMPSMHRSITYLNLLKFGSAAADNVLANVQAGGEDDPSDVDPTTVEPLRLHDRIEVHGVTFAYEGGDGPVLQGIDLTIRRGESVGIVGATGGGKTTLVDLILGLLPPTKGKVTVDGVDIRGREASWHADLGVVPQSVFLLDDTVRRNIALGVPDDDIDHAAVADAVRLAQLETFIGTLPDGLDTTVGERGVRLSGGQRQRVAIARALYRRPGVLVFDEGTSALDNLTEADLVRALESLRGRHTIITVAHRLSTVRNADRIVLLDGGRLLDSGSYDELAGRSAEFREMAGL